MNKSGSLPLSLRNRWRECPMPMPELKMTPAQMAGLVDAAFRTPHPLTFLDCAVTTFRMIGRRHDSVAAAWIGCLYADGEIEAVMSLRAAWRRGEERSPAEAGKDLIGLKL